jgi:sugar lactone lactonase YvrE
MPVSQGKFNMHKSVRYIIAFLIVSCIAACGSENSDTATTQVYSLPSHTVPSLPLPPGKLMGGTIQGTPLKLTAGNNNTVSTFTGVAETAGFGNYSTANGPPAKFNHPTGITTDGISFYVADYWNNAVRQITPEGIVTTLPIGFNLPSDITTDGTNLYVVDSGSNTIRIIDIATNAVTTIGSTDGLAGSVDSAIPADVRFFLPIGITTDGTDLYVTDSYNHTIRRINILTKAVTTLAGISRTNGATDGVQGVARLNRPGRITTDGVNLYLADFGNRAIRRIDILSGTVTTIAGASTPGVAEKISQDNNGTADGIGTTARFFQPNGITTDGTYLYVTDTYQNTVRRVEKSSPYNVTTISGIAKAFSDPTLGVGGAVDSPGTPSFYSPIGITTDGVSLFVADSENSTIRKISK